MFKPADSVMVRQPTSYGSRTNEILTGHVVSATAKDVKVAVEGESGTRTFPVAQVTKASAGVANNFFNQGEEIVQQFKRR
jgi:hypothetical protein